jgi:hypothetical protein
MRFGEFGVFWSKMRIRIKIRIKGVCLGADCFAFGELLGKVESRTIPK